MNAVEDDVVNLIEKELESANKKFPMFRSEHEGYAVMLEEYEEAEKEQKVVQALMKEMWDGIKNNDQKLFELDARLIYDHAKDWACEVIQTAAMAKKFQMFLEMKEDGNSNE